MKKILTMLLAFGLASGTTTNVISCQKEAISATEAEELKEEQKLDEEEEKRKIQLLKSEYIMYVQNLFQSHLNQVSPNLFITEANAKSNEFLQFSFLSSVLGQEKEVEVNLSRSDMYSVKRDLNNIMNINSELRKEINTKIFEEKKFGILYQGIDSVYEDFEISETLKLKSVKNEIDSKIINVEFDMSLTFNINVNNNLESEYCKMIPVYFGLASNETIVKTISKISKELGQRLLDNNMDFFKFDENKLNLKKGAYLGQNINVFEYIKSPKNAQKLIEIIDAELKNDNFVKNTSIVFKMNRVEVLQSLFKDNRMDAIDNGFVEKAVMMKDDNATDQEKINALREEMKVVGVEAFSSRSIKSINDELNLNIAKQNLQFSEYGYLCLESLYVRMQGVEIEINPIHMLYVYNPTVPYEEEVVRVLNQWQKSWNISKSTDPNALFKIRENTDMGKKIWQNLLVTNPFYYFQKRESGYYFESIIGTQFTDFHLEYSAERRNPNAKINAGGYQVNFGQLKSPPYKWMLDRSWTLILVFDSFKYRINFAKNPKYVDNFWYGSVKSKFIIERT